jgi:UDP-N-acetylglucosamine/UDP-N-acetylgalactosamine diphosphorylase
MTKGRNTEEKRIIEIAFEKDQGHLFHFWEELNEVERDCLISELKNIDYRIIEEAKKLFHTTVPKAEEIRVPDVISVPKTQKEIDHRREALQVGEEFIRSGRIAAFTAAGGQSSRLGLDIPKGAFPVTPVKKKSLFQVHAEKVLFMQKKYAVHIPWIIMVSATNREPTVQFFREHDYFGLKREDLRFIDQGMFPALDEKGHIFLKDKYALFLSPTGHGGTFSALADTGTLSWLKQMGIEEIFYFQVDNVLIKILDPAFIGYHRRGRCEMSSKAVHKADPKEKIGVFALVDGKVSVIEYSEIADVVSHYENLNEDSFTAGSIAIHMINVDFAQKMASEVSMLPLHLAHKAIPHMNLQGEWMPPSKPNGYKIETFIFDALKSTSSSIIMEVQREDEFSPLKNRKGPDSPQTILKDQLVMFARWLERAGIHVFRGQEGLPVHRIEISPLLAVSEEEFLEKAPRGLEIKGDTYIE